MEKLIITKAVDKHRTTMNRVFVLIAWRILEFAILPLVGAGEWAKGAQVVAGPGNNISEARIETLEGAWQIALTVGHRVQASRKTTEESLLSANVNRYPCISAAGGYTVLDEVPATVLSLTGVSLSKAKSYCNF